MRDVDTTITSVVSKLRELADSIEAHKPVPVIIMIDHGDGVDTIVYSPPKKALDMLELGVESVTEKIKSMEGLFTLKETDPSKAN